MDSKSRIFLSCVLISTVMIQIQAEATGGSGMVNSPLSTDFHPFESLSLVTKIVIYVAVLLLVLACVIAACSCCFLGCMLYRKSQTEGRPRPYIVDSRRAEDTYSSNSFAFTNHTAITPISQHHDPTHNECFGQETSQGEHGHPMVPTSHAPASTFKHNPIVRVPSASKGVGERGSIRSVPDETMNASNRTASNVIHASTMSGGVCYQTAL